MPKTKSTVPHIHYILDGYNDAYRVWCSWEMSDQFDVVPIADFPLKFVQRFPSIFIEDFPEDDQGINVCRLCKRN